jgi:hypothetical protein
MATLYDLSSKYRELLEVAEQVDPEAFEATLESIDDLIEDKADSYAVIDKKLKAEEDMFKDEIKRLQERKRSIAKKRKSLKDNLYDGMKLAGKEKIKTDKFSFWIQNNPPALQVEDERKVPKDFFIEQAPKLDKKSLMNYLKENEDAEIEGVELTQSEGVRFK